MRNFNLEQKRPNRLNYYSTNLRFFALEHVTESRPWFIGLTDIKNPDCFHNPEESILSILITFFVALY